MAFRHRFLIDECLSPRLADVAVGLADITHVNCRGSTRPPDPIIAQWCVADDHILVTNNARDFRRHYAAMDLHPGVVILLPGVDRGQQCTIFAAALPAIAPLPDLINYLFEIGLDGSLTIVDWPTP